MVQTVVSKCEHSEPVNVTSFGKRILAEIITDLKMRSSWIIHVGSTSNGKSPQKKTQGGTGRLSEDGSRGGGHMGAQSKSIIDRMQLLEKKCDLQLCSEYPEIYVWPACMDLLNKRFHIVEAPGYSTLMSEESFFNIKLLGSFIGLK